MRQSLCDLLRGLHIFNQRKASGGVEEAQHRKSAKSGTRLASGGKSWACPVHLWDCRSVPFGAAWMDPCASSVARLQVGDLDSIHVARWDILELLYQRATLHSCNQLINKLGCFSSKVSLTQGLVWAPPMTFWTLVSQSHLTCPWP